MEQPKKSTMDDLLVLLDRFDDGDASISVDQVKQAAMELMVKVDDYRERMDWLEKRAEMMRERASTFAKAAGQMMNQCENVSRLLLWNMQAHKFEKLAGNDYKVKLSERSDVEITIKSNPDSLDYIKYPDLVERSYKWKRSEIKSIVKKDPEKWVNFGKPVKRPQLYWSINKEGEK